MKNIQLLDCTLREAPVDNFFIGSNFYKEFIYRSEKIGLDVIECGFLKDVEYVEGSNCFDSVERISKIISPKKSGIMYVALIDVGRFSIERLTPYDGKSIDGIRICFKHGQQEEALYVAAEIKCKGYKVFIQHVDTLDYSDVEIINFVDKVNDIMPYSYSIVDTFGSMYGDDMKRLSMLINYHLDKEIILGLHTHNNLMLANSNEIDFIGLYAGQRNIMVDTSVLGCGRGAGNANTELLIEFLNKRYNANYNLNEALDLIDNLMPQIKRKCTWGYEIPYLLSGVHSAHVYNVNYLMRKHNINLKDLRAIIEELDDEHKKQYDYSFLEQLYMKHMSYDVDDSLYKGALQEQLTGKKILLLAPGKTLISQEDKIKEFVLRENPTCIGINDSIPQYKPKYLFFSSENRFARYLMENNDTSPMLIITSNIVRNNELNNQVVVNYGDLVKSGWVNLDSSMIMFLRLMAKLGILEIYMAGFDGFKHIDNYYNGELVTGAKTEDLQLLNKENNEMIKDIMREYPLMKIVSITDTMYEVCKYE